MDLNNQKSLSQDDHIFLNELRHNHFLEREQAYHKINAELEKKTNAIIEKIEKYSTLQQQKKTKATNQVEGQLSANGSGDYELGSERNKNHLSKMETSCSMELVTLFKGDDGSGDSQLPKRRVSSALSTTSMPLALSDKLHEKTRSQNKETSLSHSSLLVPETGTGAERRQQSRLQKATESVVNCLQSKLVNYESRLTELHLQHRQKIQENTMLESKVRALEEDRERLLRTVTSLQGSLDKQSKIVETAKSTASTKSHVAESMKKEIESLKRETKQNSAQIQSLLTRLNRTTEDNEKLKAQNKSVNLHMREIQAETRTKAEEQHNRIVGLEQERTLLSSTVAKQAHLLKNLYVQKVILEKMANDSAAKCYRNFTTNSNSISSIIINDSKKQTIGSD